MTTASTTRSGFGTTTTPHLYRQRFSGGAWGPGRIEPGAPLTLGPLAHALHYGASIFEGFKAHRQPDGSLALFRPLDHLRRLNRSAQRMCMPEIDPEALCGSISEFVRTDGAQDRKSTRLNSSH